MAQVRKLRELLDRRVVFLDGGAGTWLLKHGMPGDGSTEEWALEHRELLSRMHREYIEAGPDIILTCTFGGTEPKLGSARRVFDVNHALAETALKTAGGKVLVGASVGPTGELLHPSGTLTWNDAYRCYLDQARALSQAGIDIFFLETFSDPRELKAAILAVRDTSPGGFISAQMSFGSQGRTLSGTGPSALAAFMDRLPVDACGVNCSTGPQEMLAVARELTRFSRKPVAAEPNAGLPVDGWYEMSPKTFASRMEDLAAAGCSILGGCCGTGPAHVRQYVESVGHRPSKKPGSMPLPMLSSVERTVPLGQKLLAVGESINPTGRKSLQSSIRNGDFFAVLSLARAQGRADVIDVNLGLEDLLPEGFIQELFSRLSIGTPLSVDLSNPDNIEAAFCQMGGIGLLNSLIADEEFIGKRIGSLLRHGGYAVLLPMDARGPGRTPEERLNKILKGTAILKEMGFHKSGIVADPVVQPAATGAGAELSLKTLKLLKEEGYLTIAGISNVSHGLPGRSSMNAALLAAMAPMGLDLAIIDVLDSAVLGSHRASNVLLGNTEVFQQKLPRLDPQGTSPDFMAILRKSIIVGDRRNTEASARELLESGTEAEEILKSGLSQAMQEVGDLYRSKKLFLPHLIAAAEASRTLTRLLEPHLREGSAGMDAGHVVLASVKGDIHDIGKNLVALFLENAGFRVTDLGKDVDAETIVRSAVEVRADIIALSALMSTTAPKMKAVIDLAAKECPHSRILVGGAVISREYADSIGADGYAPDACGAVEEARRLTGGGTE